MIVLTKNNKLSKQKDNFAEIFRFCSPVLWFLKIKIIFEKWTRQYCFSKLTSDKNAV
jgi:hypothetical protein